MIPTTAVCEPECPTSWKQTASSSYQRWQNGSPWRRRRCPASATAWPTPTTSPRTCPPLPTRPCPRPRSGTHAPTRAESVRTIDSPERKSSCTNSILTGNPGCVRWSSSSPASRLTVHFNSTAWRGIFAPALVFNFLLLRLCLVAPGLAASS